MELERLEQSRVVQLRPEDLLVFRASGPLTLDEKAALFAALEGQTGHSRILILDAGAELAVLRPSAQREEPAPARDEILPTGQRRTGKAPGAIS